MRLLWILTLLIVVCVGRPSQAQELRGTVLRPDGQTPIGGVVVLLVHETRSDSILARAVTSERGTFSLKAPGTMAVRLRALRIGFEPEMLGTFQLVADSVRITRATLTETRVRMAQINVNDTKRCDVRPDGAMLVAQLFTQAKTALFASTTKVYGSNPNVQFTDFTRHEDTRGRLLAPIERVTNNGASTQAYGSWPVDSLLRYGYVVAEKDGGASYYAPDANILLSDAFVERHCLQLVKGTGDRSGSIGIGFRPVNRPRNVVDVTGTLWLDSATSELQTLEYSYDPIPGNIRRHNLGGSVEYARMDNGAWLISGWALRIPKMESGRSLIPEALRASVRPRELLVLGIQVSGGEVQSVRVSGEVLFANTGALLAGSTRADVMAVVSTPTLELDSTEGSACRQPPGSEYIGLVRGQVIDRAGIPVVNATVDAAWKDNFAMPGPGLFTWSNRGMTTKTGPGGLYYVCALPMRRPIGVIASLLMLKSRATMVRLTEDSPTAEIRLMLPTGSGPQAEDPFAADAAPISNPLPSRAPGDPFKATIIVTNATGQPIQFAVVMLNGGSPRVTDENGELTLAGVQGDSLSMLVRRMGFAPFQGKLARATRSEPFRLTMLPTSQTLDLVNVRAKADRTPLERTGFYDRMMDVQKGAVVGEFYTPEQLDARNMNQLSQILAASRFAKLSRDTHGVIMQGRANCAMELMIDGLRTSVHQKDRDGIPTIDELVQGSHVMAIEIYPSIATAPTAVQPLTGGGSCGIIAVWTGGRR